MKLYGGKHSGNHRVSEQKTAKHKERMLDFLSDLLNRGKWKKLRIPLIVVGCVVLAVLVVIIGYSIWEKPPETAQDISAAVITPKPAVSEVPILLPEEVPEEQPVEPTPTPEPTPEPLIRKDDCYTFVLLAYDQIGANTDTIIVGRMDVANDTLDLVNVPRDTLVNVSWPVKKVNTILAYEKNDMDVFVSHLSRLIGFSVDCYAVVDIKAVQKLVDCIGGVYYNVPRNMDYDDPTQDLHIHISKGYQLLYGEDAVKVLRFRMGNDDSGYPNGDLGRIATQQDFLKSIAAQMLTLGNIPNLDKAIDIFQTYVKTNLTANNIAFFIREFLTMGEDGVRFHTLPGTGINIRGGSFYQLVPEETRDLINQYLNPYHQDIPLDQLDILTYQGEEGAVSTTGEVIPKSSFYNFGTYVPPATVSESNDQTEVPTEAEPETDPVQTEPTEITPETEESGEGIS